MTKKSRFDNISAEYFDLNLSATNGEEAVVGGGYEHCGSKYYVDRKGFRYYTMEYIEGGEGWLTLQGKRHHLCAGTVFSFGPHIPHKIETHPENTLVKHYTIFTGKKLIELVQQMGLTSSPLHVAFPFKLDELFKNLLSFGAHESPHQKEMCYLQFRQILLYICDTSVGQNESRSAAWQTFLRIRHYIEQNFFEIKSLDQLASTCHIDKSYLCRLFQRYGKESPLQMITRLKMRKAAHFMLVNPNLPIKKVSERVNFDDPYYFSRVFKRYFGISPGKYVAMFRGEDEH